MKRPAVPYRDVVSREELPALEAGKYRRAQRCLLTCGHFVTSPRFEKNEPKALPCKACAKASDELKAKREKAIAPGATIRVPAKHDPNEPTGQVLAPEPGDCRAACGLIRVQ